MTTVLKSLFVLILTLFISALSVKGQENYHYTENDVANLINGIESNNDGLMRSCVYFAGKYKVEETCSVLIDLFKKEIDTSDKVLIALAIYKIGDKEAMMELLNVVNNMKESRVKNILSTIVLEHLSEHNIPFVLR